jgi:hypothetical protein
MSGDAAESLGAFARRCAASRATTAWGLACVLLSSGCASIPAGRRGVTSLDLDGVHAMDERALRACLATRARSRFAIDVSPNPNPACGEPEFDAPRLRAELWAWPWSEWPLYDRTIFERDADRVERWYRARGFYDAHVIEASVDPPDDVAPTADDDRVRLRLRVEEGEPVTVGMVRVDGIRGLDADLQEQLRHVPGLELGDRFDEALYDDGKKALLRALREASYARAVIEGRVTIDPVRRLAKIVYDVHPGLTCVFGDLELHVDGDEVPAVPIIAAAQIRAGAPYSDSALDDAQRAIFALGAFSSVELAPDMEGPLQVLRIVVSARTGNLVRRGVGAGMQLGQPYGASFLNADGTQANNATWDLHLLGFFEHRNTFGGLRRTRIEARPRIIFGDVFPNVPPPVLGLTLLAEFRQPSFLESRTNLVVGARYDVGPDVNTGDFQRHVVDAWVGPERSFFGGKLYLNASVHALYFSPFKIASTVRDQVQYGITFLEQTIRLDLRDDAVQPHAGFFFQVGLQEAGDLLPGSWSYFRATPEARAYAPLPFGLVLAGRFALGLVEITKTSLPPVIEGASVDNPTTVGVDESLPTSGPGWLGPETYRLRGGGANSNRGFLPTRLGGGVHTVDGVLVTDTAPLGGLRRWEASLELRVPLTESLGVALFADAGDVSPTKQFRFFAPQLTFGFGLRYRTIIGPIRLDLGIRQPWARCFGNTASCPPEPAPQTFLFQAWKISGAIHITIGEAF